MPALTQASGTKNQLIKYNFGQKKTCEEPEPWRSYDLKMIRWLLWGKLKNRSVSLLNDFDPQSQIFSPITLYNCIFMVAYLKSENRMSFMCFNS